MSVLKMDAGDEHCRHSSVLCSIENKPGRENNSKPREHSNETMKRAESNIDNALTLSMLAAEINDLDAQINLLGIQEVQAHNALEDFVISSSNQIVDFEDTDFHKRSLLHSTKVSRSQTDISMNKNQISLKSITKSLQSKSSNSMALSSLSAASDTPGTSKNSGRSNLNSSPSPSRKKTGIFKNLSHSLRHRIRNMWKKNFSNRERQLSLSLADFPSILSDSVQDESVRQLLQDIEVQQSVMAQARKALDVCQRSKKFFSSPEEVEFQRLLLVAELRSSVLLGKLEKAREPRLQHQTTQNSMMDLEFVGIDSVRLTLRHSRSAATGREWFLVVLSEGKNIFASSAVPRTNGPFIDFPGFSCGFRNLDTTLKLSLRVFLLRVDEQSGYVKERESISLLSSPKNLFKKSERPKQKTPASFTPCGHVELRLGDLTRSSPWRLSGLPRDSVLLDFVHLHVSYKLNLTTEHSGFLNLASESGGLTVWNRTWCVLHGHSLTFWNSPMEQSVNTQPQTVINLLHCISGEIAPAPRSLCAKPRTFLIETVRRKSPADRNGMTLQCRSSFTVLRHLMSCDSTRELVDWMSKLNEVLAIVKEWNVTDVALPAAPLEKLI